MPSTEIQAPALTGTGQATSYTWRFWAILVSISLTSILAGLEIGCIGTAMPTIVKSLGSDNDSHTTAVWVANAYFLTMTAFQPLYGQASDIFGRRTMTMLAVALFAAGSAISGAAENMDMLIAGRAVMGSGGGGILVMLEIIICDLCPQRDRPKFLGLVMSAFGVATSLGPLIGGSLSEHASWRWIFYLNLPVSAVAAVPLALFLRVRYNKAPALDMLRRVDWAGNMLFAASVTSILLALTWGGTEYSWSSWQTLVPLLLGFFGLVAFLGFETTRFVPQPTMPLRLFKNRTSLGAFGLTFVASIVTYWISYFLPVYFQAVKEDGPTQSGINILPVSVLSIPFSIVAGVGVSKMGRFRPFQLVGISLLTITVGVFSLLDADSSKATWVGLQVIAAAGIGIPLTCTLPAVQAPLAEADVAVATATWGFLRSFGGVWGVSIPAAVFNSHVNALLDRGVVSDASASAAMRDGGAYVLASGGFVQSLEGAVKQQVKSVYVDSLRLLWQVGIAFGLLGFLVALVIKEVKMREELTTDFGLVVDGEKPSGDDTPSSQVQDVDGMQAGTARGPQTHSAA